MNLTILTSFYKNKHDVLKVYDNYKNKLSNKNIKYLFINDNFQDEVWNEIERICKKDKNVTALCFDKNYGQLHAIKAGIEKIPDGNILYHDSDKTIGDTFIKKGLHLIEKRQVDIVWGKPVLSNFFLRSIFEVLYKLFTTKRYHYRSLFIITNSVAKITKSAFKSGEIIIGEILTSIDVKKEFVEAGYEHNYNNSRYNFFSKFLLAIKHFNPYLENIYTRSIFASAILGSIFFIIIIVTFFLKILGVINFLSGWLSLVLITVFLNLILIFLVCLTSLFNISQIKNLSNKEIKIIKELNET
jgi:polyisoprenyl-phosphate glycosyltransferase